MNKRIVAALAIGFMSSILAASHKDTEMLLAMSFVPKKVSFFGLGKRKPEPGLPELEQGRVLIDTKCYYPFGELIDKNYRLVSFAGLRNNTNSQVFSGVVEAVYTVPQKKPEFFLPEAHLTKDFLNAVLGDITVENYDDAYRANATKSFYSHDNVLDLKISVGAAVYDAKTNSWIGDVQSQPSSDFRWDYYGEANNRILAQIGIAPELRYIVSLHSSATNEVFLGGRLVSAFYWNGSNYLVVTQHVVTIDGSKAFASQERMALTQDASRANKRITKDFSRVVEAYRVENQ